MLLRSLFVAGFVLMAAGAHAQRSETYMNCIRYYNNQYTTTAERIEAAMLCQNVQQKDVFCMTHIAPKEQSSVAQRGQAIALCQTKTAFEATPQAVEGNAACIEYVAPKALSSAEDRLNSAVVCASEIKSNQVFKIKVSFDAECAEYVAPKQITTRADRSEAAQVCRVTNVI